MAGVEKEAIDDFSYARAGLSRGFWYLLLFLGAIFCSEFVIRFFPEISGELRWFAFAPLVLRLGGSIATQTSAFTHQGLLNDDIERGRAFRAWCGQNAVSLTVASALALAAYAYARWRFPADPAEALGISLGLFAVTLFSLALGMAVPLLAARVRLDSLKASSRFFHFTMDVLNLVIFFYFVRWWRIHV
jgi:magnesium transporter